jgi:hypothetical protein
MASMTATTATTGTAASGVTIALCACCVEHGVDPELPSGVTLDVVTCPECGGSCSCAGCVADVELLTRRDARPACDTAALLPHR